MTNLNTRHLSLFAIKLLLLVSLSCDKSKSEPELVLRRVSTGSLIAKQYESIAAPIEIGVFDGAGNAVAGQEVSLAVSAEEGSVDVSRATTNADGVVSFNWVLGEPLNQLLKAELVDDPAVSLTLSAKATYNYRTPERANDGWDIGDLASLGTNAVDLLTQGMNELRDNRYPETHSILMIHKGELLLEGYFPGSNSNGQFIEWDRTTRHEIQSASKSFRSMLIGIAIERGFIEGVDQPLFSFFPEYEQYNDEESKGRITLEHMLTMSSGLAWVEWAAPFGTPTNNLSQMYSQPANTWVPYVLSRPMAFEPGSTFVYNTGASLMLDDIIAASIDTDLGVFNRLYYSNLVEGGATTNPNAATMTPRDMARMGQVFVNGGYWKENQVISEEWIERSVTPEFIGASTSGGDYGYQWWSQDFGGGKHHAWLASGNGGQYVFVFNELDLVVVSTGGNFGSSDMFNIYNWIEDYVLKVFD